MGGARCGVGNGEKLSLRRKQQSSEHRLRRYGWKGDKKRGTGETLFRTKLEIELVFGQRPVS